MRHPLIRFSSHQFSSGLPQWKSDVLASSASELNGRDNPQVMSKMCPECLDPAANSLPAPDLLVRDEPDEDEDEDYDGGEDDENEDDEEDDGYSE